MCDDDTSALLAEIHDEPVPDDSPSLPVISVEPRTGAKKSNRVLSVTALGGRRIVVVEENFKKVLEVAGVEVRGDLTHAEFGRVLTAAKDTDKYSLLNDLLAVRCSVSPLYRVSTEAGRPWYSRPRPAVNVIVGQEAVVVP